MQLKDKNESLSTSLYRWGLDFNENLELDNKDGKTIENYMNVVNKLIEYVSSNKNIDEQNFENIDDRFFRRYFYYRDEEHIKKTGKSLKSSTKQNDKKVLIIFLNYIEEENDNKFEFQIKWNKIKFPSENKEIDYLKPELIKTILEYLMKEQKNNKSEFSYTLSFCFKLALYGGVRASEICNLNLNNFGKPYISKESKTKLIPLTIMGKARTIYTNPIPYDYIKNELNYFIKIKSGKEKLFHSKTGLPLDRVKLYRYFEEISKKLNLGKKGIHIIRRTFATNLSEAGVDLIHIQNLMRHKDIKTTTIYTARSQSRMEEAVSRL